MTDTPPTYLVSVWPPFDYDSLAIFDAVLVRAYANAAVFAVVTEKVPAFCDCLAQEIAKRDGLDEADIELHTYGDMKEAEELAVVVAQSFTVGA